VYSLGDAIVFGSFVSSVEFASFAEVSSKEASGFTGDCTKTFDEGALNVKGFGFSGCEAGLCEKRFDGRALEAENTLAASVEGRIGLDAGDCDVRFANGFACVCSSLSAVLNTGGEVKTLVDLGCPVGDGDVVEFCSGNGWVD